MSDHREPIEDGEELELDDASSSDELEGWGGGELEAAYLKAMSALEASDTAFPVESSDIDTPTADHGSKDFDHERPSPRKSPSATNTSDSHALAPSNDALELPAEVLPNPKNVNPTEPPSATQIPATPRQIIEACLFVGGDALTAGRLATVLRGDFDSNFVDREIDELNRLYAAENRPYEIRLGEGGYRLTLREEYEKIRHKVYGLGPKEVRLSQDALEVLAVVAYHQPIEQSRVEELGKPGCGAVLRQLVRRELLAVERDPAHPRDVNYKTTARFLSLFGIRNLDELPRSEQISYK